jgi:hypothetical protein
MPWPDHAPTGQSITARQFIEDVIGACISGLNNEATGEIARNYFELILSHAYLDRANHGHGQLRTLVKADGTGVAGPSLDKAWADVKTAYENLLYPVPTLMQLDAALKGIDHGGIGG